MKMSTFFKRLLCALLITATLLLSCSCVNIGIQKSTALSLDEYTVNGAMFKYFYTKLSVNNFHFAGLTFNLYRPLEYQTYISDDDKYETWADYIKDKTTDYIKEMLLYCAESKNLGITLDGEDDAKIDEIVTTIIDTIKSHSGLDSTEDAIKEIYGGGVSETDIRDAVRLEVLAEKTASAIEAGIDEKITDEKIESTYQENKQKYNVVNYFSFSFETDIYKLISEKYGDDKKFDELTSSEIEEINAYFEQAKATLKGYAEELASKTTIEEFKKYALTYTASNSFDEEYEKEEFKALSSQISATAIKEKMVEAVVKEVLEGNKVPADDVKNNTLYGIILNSNEAKLANELKANIFKSTYDENKYSSFENCRFTATETDDYYEQETWLFSSERKSGDIKAFEKSDDDSFSINITFLIDPQHKNESKPLDIALIFFDSESSAQNAINNFKIKENQIQLSLMTSGTYALSYSYIPEISRNKFCDEFDMASLNDYCSELYSDSSTTEYDYSTNTTITSNVTRYISIGTIETAEFKQWQSTASKGSILETVLEEDGNYFIAVCTGTSSVSEWALQIKVDITEAEYNSYYADLETKYSSDLVINNKTIDKLFNNDNQSKDSDPKKYKTLDVIKKI